MEDEPVVISAGLVITPESVAGRSFTSAFRGYHPAEVRQFLTRVGDELAGAAGREVELRRALQEALERAAHPDLDEDTVTTVLGEHAARLLASARETAASMTDAAQKQADATLRDAEVRVARMRDEAEGLLARRLAEADAAVAAIQQAAETDADTIAEQARADADRAVDAAKQRGKEMVTEARELRERMLGDLSRRRRTAQVQVEQLRAARERLLAAYDVVRRTVDEATAELDAAEPEARLAAEAVGRRAGLSDLPALERPDESDLGVRPRPAVEPAHAVAVASAPAPDRSLSLVATPAAGTVAGRVGAPAGEGAPAPTPTSAFVRRPPQPAPPPPSDRPPLRPQAVADAVGRNAAPPPPPASPPRPVAAPVVHSELSTLETPAVIVEPAPTNGNGNGSGNGHATAPPAKPDTLVDDLFARIRADRAPVVADTSPAEPVPSPAQQPPPRPVARPRPDPVSTENALGGRDELLESVEAGLARALKRVLQDEQNELLDRLRRLGPAPASAAAVLPDRATHTGGYRVAALPWLQQAGRAGVGFADPAPGSDAAKAHPRLDGLADELAAALVDPLRDRLARILDDADDPSAAAESVRAAYRQWKVQQVEESARHHTVTAFSVGAFAATPDGDVLQWLVEDDGHCPDCDDNALGGPTVKGRPFPTGQLHPPAHPGCRCLLVRAAVPPTSPA